ncbi:hypothetical protein Tco_0646994 [Tanacetum coccineum]
MESVLHISKCLAESQVEFTTCILQGRALTWWNNLVYNKGRTAVVTLSWEDLKKLLIEEYCLMDAIQKLEAVLESLYDWIPGMVTSSNSNTIQSTTSIKNRLTNDAIKDGIFKKDNASNKRRSDDRTRESAEAEGHFAEHYTYKVANVRPKKTCFECGILNHFRNNYPRLIRTSNQGWNRPNQVLAIEGNRNLRNNANKAWGGAFIMGVNEAHHHWLSNLQAEIIFHEKIVWIPLSNGEILEVHGERPEGKSKHLKSMKTDE